MILVPASTLRALLLAAALASTAAAGAQTTTTPAPGGRQTVLASLPAQGLFEGNRLSALAQQKLADLVVNALGLQVEVALIVPTGPWRLDGPVGAGQPDERDLTPARLAAVKKFLTDRGLDPKQVYVESRIDEKIAAPRLDVQVVGRQRAD